MLANTETLFAAHALTVALQERFVDDITGVELKPGSVRLEGKRGDKRLVVAAYLGEESTPNGGRSATCELTIQVNTRATTYHGRGADFALAAVAALPRARRAAA